MWMLTWEAPSPTTTSKVDCWSDINKELDDRWFQISNRLLLLVGTLVEGRNCGVQGESLLSIALEVCAHNLTWWDSSSNTLTGVPRFGKEWLSMLIGLFMLLWWTMFLSMTNLAEKWGLNDLKKWESLVVKPNSQLLEELLDHNPAEFTITTSRSFFEENWKWNNCGKWMVEFKTLDSGTKYLWGVVLISKGIHVMAWGNSTSMSSDSEDPTAFIKPNCPELCEIGNPLELPLPFNVPPALNDRSSNGPSRTSSSYKANKFRSYLFTLNKSHHLTKNQQNIRSIRKQ